VGVICLGVAILMVVWGQFFLPPAWPPVAQLSFWLLCFVLTLAAILIACADLFALRRRTRAERKALIEETLHDIEQEAAHPAAHH
jgi:TRAP-type C4-dicarboxylate transport system permease small subunit